LINIDLCLLARRLKNSIRSNEKITKKNNIMKKVTILLAAVFAVALTGKVTAQSNPASDSEVITITANLNTTLALTLDNSGILFEFNTLDDYNYGLGSNGGDYSSNGSVSSTSNWQLGFVATTPFTNEDGTTTMPMDNLGVTVTWNGSNTIDNNADNAVALEDQERILIDHNGSNSNAGDDDANSFTIYWEMGTQNGDMNGASLFDQDLKKGAYQVAVEFILTEVL